MIPDSSELTPFATFSGTGVITTDTFNQWRKKDNGVVQQLNLFAANSAATGIDVDNTTATISIKTGGVATINLANSAVTEAKISNLAVTSDKLAANAVITTKVASLAITSDKLGPSSVITGKIATDAVTTGTIANLAITSDKLGASSVIAGKIATDAVTTATIANLAVTSDKLAASSVIGGKIATDAVTTGTIANLAVTSGKLAANAVETIKILDAAVTESKLAANAVSTDKIATNAVTATKLSGGQTGAAPVYGARAWVTFSGTTTTVVEGEAHCAIFASGNVSKVVRSGNSYIIYFAIDMPDQYFAVAATSGGGWSGNEGTLFAGEINSFTVRSVSRVHIQAARATDGSSSGDALAPSLINVVIYR